MINSSYKPEKIAAKLGRADVLNRQRRLLII